MIRVSQSLSICASLNRVRKNENSNNFSPPSSRCKLCIVIAVVTVSIVGNGVVVIGV